MLFTLGFDLVVLFLGVAMALYILKNIRYLKNRCVYQIYLIKAILDVKLCLSD